MPNIISGVQHEKLRKALAAAFGMVDLSHLIVENLELDDEDFVIKGDGKNTVLIKLIQRCEQQGIFLELLAGASSKNPGNQALRECVVELLHSTELIDYYHQEPIKLCCLELLLIITTGRTDEKVIGEIMRKGLGLVDGQPLVDAAWWSSLMNLVDIRSVNPETDNLEFELLNFADRIAEQMGDMRAEIAAWKEKAHPHLLFMTRPKGLSALTTEQRRVVEVSSQVRMIEPQMLRKLLISVDYYEYKDSKLERFEKLLNELKAARAILTAGQLMVKPEFRDHYRFKDTDTDRDRIEMVCHIHRAALETYRSRLDAGWSERFQFIIEELYHSAFLNHMGGEHIDLIKIFHERLDQFPVEARKDLEGWRSTLEKFKELFLQDMELIELLDRAMVSRFLEMLDERIISIDG